MDGRWDIWRRVSNKWIVSPENRTITIYHSVTNIIAFPEDSELVSEDMFSAFVVV
jgi:hypothetical protein